VRKGAIKANAEGANGLNVHIASLALVLKDLHGGRKVCGSVGVAVVREVNFKGVFAQVKVSGHGVNDSVDEVGHISTDGGAADSLREG